MKINKLNYENYVIDYIEGNLSGNQKEAFDLFILDHPEIYEEIKDFISAPILQEDERISYEHKELLLIKKSSLSYLWLLIPTILIIGGFFLFGINNKSVNSSTREIKKTIPVAQMAQVENEAEKYATSSNAQPKVGKEKIENIKTQTSIKKATVLANEIPTNTNEVIYTKVNQRFAKAEIVQVITQSHESKLEIKPASSREKINEVASLSIEKSDLDLKSKTKSLNMNFSNKKIIEKRDGNWKDIKKVFATNAFEDVDLKESLSSESVNDFMKERKLLQSFIPETFTKK